MALHTRPDGFQDHLGMGAGVTWAWGVDVSTKLVAIAAYSPVEGFQWTSEGVPSGLVGAERLAAVRSLTRGIADDFYPGRTPTAIVVEDVNVGAATNAPLAQAVAVVSEALFSFFGCPVLELPIGTWKADSIGNGAAKKPEVMAHAVSLGYAGDCQDEADAVCIAQACWTRVRSL